jgi:hypothetical protein
MNQDNRHQNYGQQFGFDHYDLPPGRKSLLEKIFGESFARKASSPLVATAALLICGAAFAGIIIASYPDGKSDSESVPVVTADAQSYKEVPADPGGMDIPNRGTTIFQTMAEGSSAPGAPIENLLSEEKPIDKLAAFQRQVEQITTEDAAAPKTGEEKPVTESASATLAAAEEVPSPEADDVATALPIESAPIELKKIVADTSATGEPAQEELASASPAAAIDIPAPVAPAGVTAAPAEKPTITKAGENPETLEFVRSVLDRKDGVTPVAQPTKTASADQAAKVEPAAGTAGVKSVTPGSYYIQLGSVKSESGAAGEWGKLKKSYSTQLSSLDYRVQKADLASGTFYRIQAGPISKESAKSLCDSISAQKPGACLVTQ